MNFIACWHHNFNSGFENTNNGQWDSENRKQLLGILEKLNIKLVFTGNEHTSNCKSVLLGSIYSSDCGTVSSLKHDTTFKVYPIIIDDNIALENIIYALQKINTNDIKFFWDRRTNLNANQPDKFDIHIKNSVVLNETLDLIPITKDFEIKSNNDTVPNFVNYQNSSIQDKLYNIIKTKKLFHTGHFHWSDTSRAHNWIDVAKMLENSEDLYFCKNVIVDIFEKFHLHEKCDLIIGLGYEGNIISSKATIKFNVPYSSLPYSYRYIDHHEFEKKINFDNSKSEYKNVVIVTDVVNDGKTIRKLIHENEKDFFNNVEKIIVVSLFYTGQIEINIDILNYKNVSGTNDDDDFETDKIEFYSAKSLKVEKCPYGKNYKEECFIYKDELSCVNLFYDENAK